MQRVQRTYNQKEREKLVGDFMRLVLFQDHNKHPTRRQDINKLVLQEYKGHNLASNLLAEAQKRFQEIFGFELIEVRKITVTANLNEKGKAPKISKYLLDCPASFLTRFFQNRRDQHQEFTYFEIC